jgi:hypothetical protein
MAKIAFSKLALKKQNNIKIVQIGDNKIEVKQYLPIEEKLEMISRIINQAADANNFSNPIKLEVFTSLEIVFAYTNLSFTDKQKEDLIKLYDLFEENNIFNLVIAEIPKIEYQSIIDGVQECSDAIYTYKNSIMGVLEDVVADYSAVNMESSDIAERLNNPDNMKFLKDVLTKLG